MSHEMTWEATVLCTEVWGGAGQSPDIKDHKVFYSRDIVFT